MRLKAQSRAFAYIFGRIERAQKILERVASSMPDRYLQFITISSAFAIRQMNAEILVVVLLLIASAPFLGDSSRPVVSQFPRNKSAEFQVHIHGLF